MPAPSLPVPQIPPFVGGVDPDLLAAAGPEPEGPVAEPGDDGYCRYACPACGAHLQTTLRLVAIRFRCASSALCAGAYRWYVPLR